MEGGTMKCFVFNKALDYQRGKGTNIAFDNTGIWIKEPLGGLPGVFLSRIMAAGEQETVWHRMKAVTEAGNNMAIFIKLYGTDSLEAAKQAWSDSEASKRFLQLYFPKQSWAKYLPEVYQSRGGAKSISGAVSGCVPDHV